MAEGNFTINADNDAVGNIQVSSQQVPAQQSAQQSGSSAANASSANESAHPPVEQIYGNIPEKPVLKAPEGILFDFNQGIRVLFPANGKEYRLVFSDIDTECVLFAADVKPGSYVTSIKKFFIRFRLLIFHKGEQEPFFKYDYDAKDQLVMLQIPGGTIGDTVGWFSYAERFQKKHNCKLLIVMQPWLSEIFKKQYPDITFISKDETVKYKPYATYFLGLFFKGDVDWQPEDFRYVGLHRTAGYILGVDPDTEIPPRVDLTGPRTIKEPYVVIAAQASSQCKYWNNPAGWHYVIDFLHKYGYKVVCIDKEKFHGTGIVWNHMPAGVDVDDTGAKPLQERIDMIRHADFFIGLPSGLSWLAWCCKVPIVMVAGFSSPTTEFITPYRIINYHACHSCWNDFRENFDHFDFLWCPRHKNTERQFECTRMISGEHVTKTIEKIPAFIKQKEAFLAAQKKNEKADKGGKKDSGVKK